MSLALVRDALTVVHLSPFPINYVKPYIALIKTGNLDLSVYYN